MSNILSLIGALTGVGTNLYTQHRNEQLMNKQNAFNAQQAEITRQWNEQMDSTKYQRTVADMQGAGVNPALAMQGGITTQAASNATASAASTPFMDMSSIAQLISAMSQSKLVDAQTKNLDADTSKKEAETTNTTTLTESILQDVIAKQNDNEYRDEFNRLRNDGMKASNDLTREQKSQVRESIYNLQADTAKKIQEAKSEQEKQKLIVTEQLLKSAETTEIYSLLPFKQAMMNAQTAEARAIAGNQMAQAAYTNGMLSAGMIESIVRANNASAGRDEINALTQETLHALGIEKATVNNTKSGTFNNYTAGARNIVNCVTDVVDAVSSVAGSLRPVAKIGF